MRYLFTLCLLIIVLSCSSEQESNTGSGTGQDTIGRNSPLNEEVDELEALRKQHEELQKKMQ